MEVLAWVCTVVATVGAVLNARLSIWCFYLWIPTNALWVWYYVDHRQWASAAQFVVYFVIAIHGLVHWGRHGRD